MFKYFILPLFFSFQEERNVYMEFIKSLFGKSNISTQALAFYIKQKTQMFMTEKEREVFLSKLDYIRRKLKVSN